MYTAVRGLISLMARLGLVRISVSYADRVPEAGPVLLMMNHQSNLDPLIAGWATRRPVNMPGKAELFRVPILRWVIGQLGCYPVDRDASDAGSLRRSLQVLRRGRVLAVFPEGTRTRTGEVGPFNPTLTRLAIREGAPVVALAIDGTGKILPPGRKLPRLGVHVTVRYGKPLQLTERYGPKPAEHEIEQATETVRDQVVSLLGRT